MNGRVTPPPGVPHLHVNMPQINLMFAHFFSFPENMKTPLELSLDSLPYFLTKVTFLTLLVTFTSSIIDSYLQVSRFP